MNDLTFEWYEDALIFRVFIFTFLFRTNGKKKHLDKTDFRHCYGDFFEAATRDHKNTWSQLYVEGFFSSGTRNIDNNFFKDNTQLKILHAWNKIRFNSFSFFQDLSKHHETKINEGAWKVISCTKNPKRTQRTLHQNRRHFTNFYTLLLNLIRCVLAY